MSHVLKSISLVIIAKPPIWGRVKTRLAASIGNDQALAIYGQLLQLVASVAQKWPGVVLLSAEADDGWNGTGLEHLPRRIQPVTGLGCRIEAALNWGLEHADHTIAIGTDCPAMSVADLMAVAKGLAVVDGLESTRVAFGPAADGGYWSVAVAAGSPLSLICADDLPWSTAQLLSATRSRLQTANEAWHEGPLLTDCDDESDMISAVAAGLLVMPTSTPNRTKNPTQRDSP